MDEMTEEGYQTLPDAPITEALLDIRCSLPADVELGAMEQFHERVKEDYPNRRIRRRNEFRVQVDDGGVQLGHKHPEDEGYLFDRADKEATVQARLDGFTYNKLSPYTSWEDFSSEARRLWEEYLNVAKPQRIERLGLRYINRIELPLPVEDFSSYFRTFPTYPDSLSAELEGLFMRLNIRDPDTQLQATITQVLEDPEENDDGVPITFDIDVVSRETLSADSGDGLWEVVSSMREMKNRIFFESLTDDTLEMFQ